VGTVNDVLYGSFGDLVMGGYKMLELWHVPSTPCLMLHHVAEPIRARLSSRGDWTMIDAGNMWFSSHIRVMVMVGPVAGVSTSLILLRVHVL
jgi:hypothetical protein